MRTRDKSLIDENYELRELWLEFAKHFTHVARDLGCWRAGNLNVIDRINPDLTGEVQLNHERDGKRRNSVSLLNFRRKNGEKIYGKVNVISEEIIDSGHSYTFDRRDFDEDTVISHSFAYILRNKEREASNQNFKASTSVRTSAKVSGGLGDIAKAEASVETESTLEAALGMESAKEIDETISDTIQQPIPVKAGRRVLATMPKTRVITEQPYIVRGEYDFDILVDLENWAGDAPNGNLWTQHKARNRFQFNGREGLLRFLNGYDLNFPRMAAYMSRCGRDWPQAESALDWIETASNYYVESSGTKRRTYEHNIDVVVKNLSN